MGCYTSQNTGRLSQLASSLQIALGENTADQVMSRVYSKQFEQEFGAFALPEQMNPLEVQETLTSLRAEYETLTNALTDLAEDSDVDKEVDLRYQLEQLSTVIHDLETISQGKYSPIPLDAELEPDFNWVMQNVVHPDLVKLSERAREGKVFTNGQEKAFLDFYTRWKALSDEGFRVPSGMALARYEQMVQLFGTDQVTIPKELGEGLSVISVKKPRFVPNKQMAFEDFLPVTEQVTEVFNTNPELASVGTLEQYSQYLDSLNKPNTNPILKGNQQEQVKKFAELQERINNKEFLEGAKNAFESSKGLQEWGTQEQYNDYIARVSLGIVKNPTSGEYNYESQVKDIVYHGTSQEYRIFNGKIYELVEESLPNNTIKNIETGETQEFSQAEWENLPITIGKTFTKPTVRTNMYGKKSNGIWFTNKFNAARTFGGRWLANAYILNIKNPETIDQKGSYIEQNLRSIYSEEFKNKDSVVITNVKNYIPEMVVDETSKETGTNIVVFEPEQIHILGSKQDIEGFKEFVATKVEDFLPEPSKFSYKGIQIDVPFTLSQDQAKVLEQLIDFVEEGTPGKAITVEGAAGTGKTTIIGLLATYLGKKGTVAYMAPTHAATAQLALATSKIGNKNLPNTVASGIAPKMDGKEQQLVINGIPQYVLAKKTTGQFKGLGDKILVVDESSMLDTATYEKIKNAAKNSEVTIIFMGDRGQLPSPKSKLVSPVFFENEVLTLTTVHRQKDSRLAVFLSKLRNKTQFTPLKVVGLEGVEFHSGLSSFDKAFVRLVEQDPEDTIWIGDTNTSVSAQNKKIRDHFGREGALQIGDIVMGYLGYESKQLTDPNNDFGNSANSIMYTIESIKNNQGSAEITLRSKTLDTLLEAGFNVNQKAKTKYVQLSTNDALEVDGATAETMSMWNASLSTLFEAYVKAVNNKNWHVKKLIEGELGEQFKKYDLGGDYIYDPALDKLVPYNKTNPSQDHKALVKKYGSNIFVEKGLDFGHAITAFKSQGISVKNVFVDAGTIRKVEDEVLTDKAGTPVTTVKQALLYVMMSRAKENLHVHEGNHVFEEVSLASLSIPKPPPPPPVGQGKQLQQLVEDSTKIITREEVKSNPTTLYLFGDNDIRKGLGGQAKEMRGEPNTVGISTKKIPANTPAAFKTDTELEDNKRIITQDIDKAITEWGTGKYTKAIIPQIGVGLAKLQEKAPLTWAHLQTELQRFRDVVKGQQSEQAVEGTYETLPFVTEAEKLSPVKRQEIPQGYEATARAVFMNRVVEVARSNPNKIYDLSEYFKNPSSFKGFDAFGLRMSEWVEIIDGIRIELKDSFPSNIKFNEPFRDALNNSTRRLIQGLSNRVSLETRTRLGFTINQAKKAKVAARVDILTSTPDGGVSVPFSAKHGIEKQQAVQDCISAMFYFLYEKGNGQIKVPHLIGTILMEMKNKAAQEGADKALFQDVVQAFAFSTRENKRSFLDDLLDTLDYMGYRIDKAGRDGLKNVFATAKSDPTFVPNGDVINVNAETFRDVDSEMDDALDDAIDQLNADETRLGVMRDWQDSSFEKNSKDQASARLKMLIAQQAKYEEFSYGVVDKAEDADINLDTLFPGILIQDYTQGQLRQLQGKKVYSAIFGEDYVRRQLQAKAVILQAKPIIQGIPPLVQFDSVYEKIIGVLSDKPMLTFSKAMELLKTSGNADLYRIATVLEKLGNDPKKAHLQKEFMKVVQLQYTQYLVVRTNAKKNEKGKYTQTKVINAQRNDQVRVIVGQYQMP